MKYIFLSYLNRSGSTFLVNQLSKSSEICVCPEAEILYEILLKQNRHNSQIKDTEQVLKHIGQNYKWQLWQCNLSELNSFKGTGFDLFLKILDLYKETHHKTCNYILFKHNYLINFNPYYSDINNLFWIVLLRNPYSIYASQKTTISPYTGKVMCNNPIAFIDGWNSFYKKSHQNQNSNNFLLTYEDLILNCDKWIKKIHSFLKLSVEWNLQKKNKGQINKMLNEEYKSIHPDIDKRPNPASILKWNNSLSQIEVCALSNFMIRQIDYIREPETKKNLFYYISLSYWIIQRKIVYIKIQIKDIIKRGIKKI